MYYTIKHVQEKHDVKTLKKNETIMKDLLPLIPSLKKHKLEGEVITKIRKLREGRKSKSYTLELTRKFQGKELKVSSPVHKVDNKLEIMQRLKAEITSQIQDIRRSARPPVEDYTFSQGVTVKKLAEVYLEPGAFIEVFKKKIRQDMTRGKKPNTGDNYIGVELELASKYDRNYICDKLFDAGLGRYVTVKDDGSIGSGTDLRNEYPFPHEICILVRQNEFESVILKLCDVLNNQCEVKVDKTCGLHVHVDMRNRPVETAFNNLVSCQQFLYAMLPANRRNSRYSYPVKGTQWRINDQRYHGINSQAYSKYKTLEARMHCGTTQGKKIVNWIKILLAISDAPKISKAPTSITKLKSAVPGLTDEVVTYMKARIAKFKKQHEMTPPTSEEPGTMPEIEPVMATPDESVSESSEVA